MGPGRLTPLRLVQPGDSPLFDTSLPLQGRAGVSRPPSEGESSGPSAQEPYCFGRGVGRRQGPSGPHPVGSARTSKDLKSWKRSWGSTDGGSPRRDGETDTLESNPSSLSDITRKTPVDPFKLLPHIRPIYSIVGV